MEEARERFLRSFGYSETIAGGIGFIMPDLSIMYLGQAHYGQTLEVEIAITEFTARGFAMVYKVADAETGLELARAKINLLFYDYQRQRTIPVPRDFREKFTG
jgi:acyl-CoA thioesterase FadM